VGRIPLIGEETPYPDGMAAMAWWAIPIVATLVATVWVTRRNRPRRRVPPQETVAEYARFRTALTALSATEASHREGRRTP
jgi:cytochrome c-type biogenesis protein CcmH/NrfF